MKKYLEKVALLGALLSLILLGTAPSVLAVQVNSSAGNYNSSSSSASNNSAYGKSNASNATKTNSSVANNQQGLNANQLKICQDRQTTIDNLMNRITIRVNNQVNLFGEIATTVENFSTKSGKTVTNYSSLVNSINTAKSTAQTGLATLQQSSSINCTSGSPRAQIATFRGYVKVEITNLENYRISVKNLIVAVAKANNTTLTNQNNSGN